MLNNAEEISVEGINNAGDEKRPEEILFLGKFVVSGMFSSSSDISTLVPGIEIDDIPNS